MPKVVLDKYPAVVFLSRPLATCNLPYYAISAYNDQSLNTFCERKAKTVGNLFYSVAWYLSENLKRKI